MVYSLLSILGTHNRDDMSHTLLAMSTSSESCLAMRQSGLFIHSQSTRTETKTVYQLSTLVQCIVLRSVVRVFAACKRRLMRRRCV